MRNKAIFLDRDGTINIDYGYVHKVENFKWIDGVFDALKVFNQLDYKIIIITNQSGIARGYFNVDEYNIINHWMISELEKQGINIDGTYYCPHHPEGKIIQYSRSCDCRKPGLQLFFQAVNDFDIDLSKSYAIGDKLRDVIICEKTECKGFLIGKNEEIHVRKDILNGKIKNLRYCHSLYDCACEIMEDVIYNRED